MRPSWVLLLLAGGATACAVALDPRPAPAPDSAAEFAGMREVDDPHVHRLIQVSPRIWSGGAPEGDATFAALAARGVRTMVSVDGARPDVELAAKYGMRYVHVPIGYDAVSEEAGRAIAAVMAESEGGVYFH
jgi:hypothetical protein